MEKRFFTTVIMLLVELAEAHSKSEELASTFDEGATREELLSDLASTVVLKSRIMHSLSDTCSARRRTSRDVLLQIVGYQ